LEYLQVYDIRMFILNNYQHEDEDEILIAEKFKANTYETRTHLYLDVGKIK